LRSVLKGVDNHITNHELGANKHDVKCKHVA